jgi:hypothetical protein
MLTITKDGEARPVEFKELNEGDFFVHAYNSDEVFRKKKHVDNQGARRQSIDLRSGNSWGTEDCARCYPVDIEAQIIRR